MLSHETTLRVRYAETDQMGVVYYGVYAQYFEVGRVEFIRHYGLSYRELEESGIQMPVTEMRVRYLRPAKYDDLLTLKTVIRSLPAKRVVMETSVYNPEGKLCVEGIVTLAFIEKKSGRTVDPPVEFMQILEKNWL